MCDPLVSVIIPCYECSAFVGDVLRSVVGQTYQNLEVLAVDDGSRDNTVELLRGAARQDPRIQVVCCAQNGGVSAARNVGLKHATGDYVVFVDADDTIHEAYVETLLAAARQHDADLVVCGYTLVQQGRVLGEYPLGEAVLTNPSPRQLRQLPVQMCSHLYKSEMLHRESACFPESSSWGEDTAFNYRCYPSCRRVVCLPHYCGYICRLGSHQATARLGQLVVQMSGATRFLAEHWQRCPREFARELLMYYALHALRRIYSQAEPGKHLACVREIGAALHLLGITGESMSFLRTQDRRMLCAALRARCYYPLSYRIKFVRRRLRAWFRYFNRRATSLFV